MLEVDFKKRSGSYYTKPEIVSLILDLVGYTSNKELYSDSLLEPSTGAGAFLAPSIKRLLNSVVNHKGRKIFQDESSAYTLLKSSICSIELDKEKYNQLYSELLPILQSFGASRSLSHKLLDTWLIQTDFLLWNKPVSKKFDYIVGNPPYIRIESLDKSVEEKYRKFYKTLFDRADIYIAFIEHGLEMLSDKGKLNFICTDRFTKNRYGKMLRKYINNNFHVDNFIDIHNTQPFVDKVSAYPCVFTLSLEKNSETRTIKMDDINDKNLQVCRDYLINHKENTIENIDTYTLKNWFKDYDPWILNGDRAQKLLQKLEANHKLITEDPHFIKIGIGVATGAKQIYLVNPTTTNIENEVLIPVVTKDDIKTGKLEWSGKYVINPYNKEGTLIDLDNFPKLKLYLLKHEEKLKARNTAKKNPNKWYKTIDRIYPERIKEPKLLIPDIKKENLLVLDKGEFYPEHSLYYIWGGTWNIQVLQALLTSTIVKFFIWSYATKMRGDYLRYQAQYLKKIRLPENITDSDKNLLLEHFKEGNINQIDLIAKKLYNLTFKEYKDIKDLVGV